MGNALLDETTPGAGARPLTSISVQPAFGSCLHPSCGLVGLGNVGKIRRIDSPSIPHLSAIFPAKTSTARKSIRPTSNQPYHPSIAPL